MNALRTLEHADLPVPHLVAEDANGGACEVPTLLLTWLPGEPPGASADLDAFVHGLADPLPAIHAIDVPPSMRAYEPYFVSDGIAVEDLRPPPWASDVRVWERAFEIVASGPPETPMRFIHRDYHHGNTVWHDGELTGVVDWTTGCVGPPGSTSRRRASIWRGTSTRRRPTRSSRPGACSSRASRRTRSGTCSMPSTGSATARRPT